MGTHDFGYGDLLARNAKVHGTRAALLGHAGTFTHAQLHADAAALANGFAAFGVQAGDRIAVLSYNRPEILALLGAAALRGAMLVLLNARASAAETAAVLADAEPRLVVVERALAPLLDGAKATVPVFAFDDEGTNGFRPWSGFFGADEALPVAVKADALLVGIPTAAVQGQARIALLSHRALLHQAHGLSQAWQLGPDDRHLGVLPLFHMAGLGLALAAQPAGAASVLQPHFDAEAALQAIRDGRVSYFASFAPMLGMLLDAAEARTDAPLASLRVVTGLEPPEVAARLERCCPQARFWRGYGQTETAGFVTLAPCTGDAASAGVPLPGVALRIERADGGEAAAGDSGEVVVRGPGVFDGYWRRTAATAHAARGGWHHTGDRGRIRAHGVLAYEGRLPEKALIKSGGENIYPAEVEQALLAHPGLEAAVVFGVPVARWGEAVRAVCVPRVGADVSPDEVVPFVQSPIARFKRPRDVLLVASLPRAADGTADREAVAALHGGR